MKTKYYTDDGKVFDNKDEAQAYENELAQVKAKREKLEQEKQTRRDAIKTDYEALLHKIENYSADYKEPVTFMNRIGTSAQTAKILMDLLNTWIW